MSQINLAALPQPLIIEALSYETILEAWLADLLAIYPEASAVLALESEPLRKLLEVGAYREMMLRADFNSRAKGLFLAYATGTDLDHVGVTYFQVERLEGESDSNYRTRISLRPDSYSTAGSANSYRYHAMSASAQVKDASAINGGPGQVIVTVLSTEGDGTADSELLQTVTDAVNADEVRPLTDTVSVQSAAILTYTIEAIITAGNGPSPAPVLETAIAKAEEYAARQCLLGKGMKRDAVLAALWIDGVEDVVLIAPLADLPATPEESACCTGITVTIEE
jgi:phage-related baseplate assembly protein